MNNLNARISIFFMSVFFSLSAFSSEPQIATIKEVLKTVKQAKSADLGKYEINNGELVELYAFKVEKIVVKKNSEKSAELFVKNNSVPTHKDIL